MTSHKLAISILVLLLLGCASKTVHNQNFPSIDMSLMPVFLHQSMSAKPKENPIVFDVLQPTYLTDGLEIQSNAMVVGKYQVKDGIVYFNPAYIVYTDSLKQSRRIPLNPKQTARVDLRVDGFTYDKFPGKGSALGGVRGPVFGRAGGEWEKSLSSGDKFRPVVGAVPAWIDNDLVAERPAKTGMILDFRPFEIPTISDDD